MKHNGFSNLAVAKRMGRHHMMIGRELKCNTGLKEHRYKQTLGKVQQGHHNKSKAIKTTQDKPVFSNQCALMS